MSYDREIDQESLQPDSPGNYIIKFSLTFISYLSQQISFMKINK